MPGPDVAVIARAPAQPAPNTTQAPLAPQPGVPDNVPLPDPKGPEGYVNDGQGNWTKVPALGTQTSAVPATPAIPELFLRGGTR